MRSAFLPVGILTLVLLVVLFGARGCRLSDEAQAWKVKYDAYRAMTIAEREQMNQRVAALQADIAAKDAEIAVHKQAVFTKNEQIAKKNTKIAELEQEFLTLTDCPAQVVNLQNQVAAWKEQFATAQEIIVVKDEIIAAWEVKFTNQVAITEQVQAALDRADALNALGEKRIAVLERDNKRLGLADRIEKMLLIGAAGYVGYKLLSGEK